jgi:hypothetical protein
VGTVAFIHSFARQSCIQSAKHVLIDSGLRASTKGKTLAAVVCSQDQNGGALLIDERRLGESLRCRCGAVSSVQSLREARAANFVDLDEGFVSIPLEELL